MKIFINGNSVTVNQTEHASVADALAVFLSEQQTKMSYAVALNGTFVSKQAYAETSLKQDDALDILFPIVGG